jgi:AmiR/NasT family two-component response regulator
MERFSIDASRAFEMLRRVSQDNNVKLRSVAQNFMTTCHTPHQ